MLVRKRWHVASLMVLLVVAATGVVAIARIGGAGALDGQPVGDQDLSRSEQLALIDQFSPVPTPRDATDVKLRYQRFQDWSFEASFTLTPEALEQYTSALQPAPPANTGVNGTQRYLGKRIGAFVGWIDVDRARLRVWVHHTSS